MVNRSNVKNQSHGFLHGLLNDMASNFQSEECVDIGKNNGGVVKAAQVSSQQTQQPKKKAHTAQKDLYGSQKDLITGGDSNDSMRTHARLATSNEDDDNDEPIAKRLRKKIDRSRTPQHHMTGGQGQDHPGKKHQRNQPTSKFPNPRLCQ
ncbi:uncharacterized protein DS421_1g04700 [Arachis hypogaea]|nr:uncharacterized protein DS421_1g04700 [Arachis hypogaea]